jgi:hypothetical protein
MYVSKSTLEMVLNLTPVVVRKSVQLCQYKIDKLCVFSYKIPCNVMPVAYVDCDVFFQITRLYYNVGMVDESEYMISLKRRRL